MMTMAYPSGYATYHNYVSDNFLNNSKKVLRNIFKSKCRDRETEKEPIYVTIPNEQIKL